MQIRYVCPECNKVFNLLGFMTVNAVGRKSCENCGWNGDELIVVNRKEYEIALKKRKQR